MKNTKTIMISFRLTLDEYDMLMHEVNYEKKNRTEYIKDKILPEKEISQIEGDLGKLSIMAELDWEWDDIELYIRERYNSSYYDLEKEQWKNIFNSIHTTEP